MMQAPTSRNGKDHVMVSSLSTSRTEPFCPAPARLSLARLLRRAVALRRSRQALADLSEEQLVDIGLSVDQARKEARRPVWDAPAHWYH